MRSPRSRGVSTLAVSGVLMAFVFSVLAPAHASPPAPLQNPPSLRLIAPNGGEILTGGGVFFIQWTMDHPPDTDLFVTLSFSYDGGSTYYFLTADYFMTGTAAFLWDVPAYDTPGGRIRVCAEARDGSVGCVSSAASFSIVVPPPPPTVRLTLLSPANRGTEVPRNNSIIITAAGMDPARTSWQITPPVTFAPMWLNNNTLLFLVPLQPMPACTQFQMSGYGYDVSGGFVGPTNWTFRTACNHPYVVASSPAHGTMNVPLDDPILIAFSEPMNTTTVVVTIIPPLALTPNWSTGDTVLTLTHTTPFSTCTAYTITVVDGRSKVGHWLVPGPGSNPWTFYTVCSGPYIAYTEPADGEVDVPLDASVHIVFSASMDAPNVTWTVSPAFPFTPQWDQNGTTSLWLTHYTVPFPSCISFTIMVNGTDVSGNPLVPGPVPNPFTFRTGGCQQASPWIESTSPVAGEQSVLLDASIVVTFSEPMDRKSLLYTFWWSGPPPFPFNHSWSSNDTVVTFTHVDPFPACTVITAIIDANDTDGNPLVPGPVPNPWDWTTLCGSPVIVSTYPSHGSIDFPRTDPLVVTFSEGMNTSSVSVQFTPSVTGVNLVWPSPDSLTVTHDELAPCTQYTVQVTGRDPDGNALVPGPVPNPWSFTSDCGITTLVLQSPVGGESWTGGSGHAVRFVLSNGELRSHTFTVLGVYAYAGGASGGTVGTMSVTVSARSSRTLTFPWIVPAIDAVDVVVNVSATDGNTTLWAESGPFEIDSTPPQVTSASPNGTNIPLDSLLVVRFSEPMNVLGAPLPPLTITPTVGALVFQWAPARDGLSTSLIGTAPCTTYTVTVGDLRDDSDPGNPIRPFSWTFTTVCSPTVDLLLPDGGEDWTGGSDHAITWISDDRDDAFLVGDLSYSTDGGVTYAGVIAAKLTIPIGAGSFVWTLPRIDFTTVRVRIVVTDSGGNTATDASSADFMIDSTPPRILASFPSDGAVGFKTTREVWFVFTERIDRASFQSAFGISPNPGGLTFSWSLSNLDTDLLIVGHAPFKSNTAYTVTFGTAAKDDSDPGNFVPSPLLVRFSTSPPPNVNPPVAKAVGKNQVLVGEPVTLDGTGSTGSITSYVWRIVDNQGRFVAVHVGPIAVHTFRDHGRYSVTLIVTDQNGLTDEDTIEIAVTSNRSSNDLILAGGALFASALLIGATEAGRLSVFSWILFPLYVRRKRNEILEHQTRGMILGYIMVHPGDTYTDIKRNLLLSNGTLSYHLTVMEREGIVRSQVRGTRKLFFPEGIRVPEDGGGLHEVQFRMFRAIQAVPGLAVKDIAGALGITSQHALYHLRALAAQGYVRLERQGFALRCYAEPGKGPPLHEDGAENG